MSKSTYIYSLIPNFVLTLNLVNNQYTAMVIDDKLKHENKVNQLRERMSTYMHCLIHRG